MPPKPFKLPIYLIVLDGFGVAFLVLGFLAATGTDFGLPALESIWPLLALVGIGLMAPMMLWVVKLGLKARKDSSEKGG